MTTDTTTMSLKGLLDGLLVAHRQDIHAYGAGHLNESNLPKPPNEFTHKPWKSAEQADVSPRRKKKLQKPSLTDSAMHDTLAIFSMGTAGSLADVGNSAAAGQTRLPGGRLAREDSVIVEELNVPDLMLTKTAYPTTTSTHPDQQKTSAMFGWTRDDVVSKHKFIPGHQSAVTKKDAYDNIVEFERGVLRKQDANERNVLAGARTAHILEQRLTQELASLSLEQRVGANFHRLQAYSRIFDDLIQNSPTFGYMLGLIKDEYDDYVSRLLDVQPDRHRSLHQQVEQLSSRGSSKPDTLTEEMQRVQDLADEAHKLIELNEKLREQLATEEEKSSEPEPEAPVLMTSCAPHQNAGEELVEQVEALRLAILQRGDEINELKGIMSRDMVPATVCSQLEQCIKDTEVELQKLRSQREYFDRSFSEMETDLKHCIEVADTTDKDEKRVWKKILEVSGDASPDDEDISDEHKWSWYIS